jgi:hypothetical protein
MAWTRSETSILNHRKFVQLDPAAVGLWTMGNVYCMDQLSDGLIPRFQVPRLIFAKPAKCYALAETLVKAGLWEHDGEDYRVHDYLDWNPSAAEILAEREAARERMRAYRRGGRSSERSPERAPERSGEVTPHVRDENRSRSRREVPPYPPHERSPEQPRPPDLVIDAGMFNDSCPETRWRAGLCVRTEYLEQVPANVRFQCPHHNVNGTAAVGEQVGRG